MEKYLWALNPQKLQRAIGKKGVNATEAEIKAEYIKIGGKLAIQDLKTITPEVKPVERKAEVVREKTNDIPNKQINNPATESNPDNGGTNSPDNSVVSQA